MPARRRPGASRAAMIPNFLDKLEWRNAGPFRGGRVVAVAGDPRDRNTFYMGSTGGGVWKTGDGEQAYRVLPRKQSAGRAYAFTNAKVAKQVTSCMPRVSADSLGGMWWTGSSRSSVSTPTLVAERLRSSSRVRSFWSSWASCSCGVVRRDATRRFADPHARRRSVATVDVVLLPAG